MPKNICQYILSNTQKICNYLNAEGIHFLDDVRNLFLGKDVEQRTGIWEK